jgi:ribonucleoside-diphosphate reductase alpha chain
VDRAIDYLRKLSENRLDDETYEELRQGILNMEAMPSMRLLAMAGHAADINNLRIYNCSYVPIDSIDAIVETLIISMNGCGVGFSVEQDYIDNFPK